MQAQSRAFSRPFQPVPRLGEAHGNYREQYECLNVRNPNRGMRLVWANVRDEGMAYKLAVQGYVPVRRSDGVEAGGQLPAPFAAPQGDYVGFGGLMLMQIPLDKFREIQARKQERAHAGLDLPTQTLLFGSEAEIRGSYGKNPPKGGEGKAFFALPDHGRNGFEVREGEDNLR